MIRTPAPVVILISGRGSNLRSIVEHRQRGELAIDIRAVISNKPDADGLRFAQAAGLPTAVVDHRDFASREAYERALMQQIDRHAPALVVLAGFMRVLGNAFVAHYHGRMINIHPSLLPAFPGLDTHARALAAGVKTHGASVHFVTEAVDGGPVILQAGMPVTADDTPASLAARVLREEHRIYPIAIRWFVEGRVTLRGDTLYVDGRPQSGPVQA